MCWEFGALLMELEICSWPISRSSFSLSHNLTAKQEWKREGNLIWPVLIDNVRPDMRIAWEEPFGPVIPVLRIKTVEEGIHHCNANNFALQVHIFCKKLLLQTCHTMFKGSPKYHHFSNVTEAYLAKSWVCFPVLWKFSSFTSVFSCDSWGMGCELVKCEDYISFSMFIYSNAWKFWYWLNEILQGCVFTKNIDKAIMISDAMESGTIQINAAPARGPDHFPFQVLHFSPTSRDMFEKLAIACKRYYLMSTHSLVSCFLFLLLSCGRPGRSSISCCGGNYECSLIHANFLCPSDPYTLVWIEMGWSCHSPPMRDIRMQWSQDPLSLV